MVNHGNMGVEPAPKMGVPQARWLVYNGKNQFKRDDDW